MAWYLTRSVSGCWRSARQSRRCRPSRSTLSRPSPGGRSPACGTTWPTATSTPPTRSCRRPSTTTCPSSSAPSTPWPSPCQKTLRPLLTQTDPGVLLPPPAARPPSLPADRRPCLRRVLTEERVGDTRPGPGIGHYHHRRRRAGRGQARHRAPAGAAASAALSWAHPSAASGTVSRSASAARTSPARQRGPQHLEPLRRRSAGGPGGAAARVGNAQLVRATAR
jgi:hypothetical protein